MSEADCINVIREAIEIIANHRDDTLVMREQCRLIKKYNNELLRWLNYLSGRDET